MALTWNNAPSDSARRRILLVEDESPSRDLLRAHLSLADFEIEEVGDGAVALECARSTKCDLIILNAILPGIDGLTLCRAIRSEGANVETSILMLNARDTESDTVLGLDSGADDYLGKPFGIRELLARVSAILRRHRRFDEQTERATASRVHARDVALDAQRRQAEVRGDPVELTKQEFDVLYLLAARPGIVFSRAVLLAKVWGGDSDVTERTVDTVVSRLRRKIERDARNPGLILTAWGVGYKFVDID